MRPRRSSDYRMSIDYGDHASGHVRCYADHYEGRHRADDAEDTGVIE
jgi:hypothetical protein